MHKAEAYQQLVEKRKKHKFENGLTNPADTKFDIDELDPWAQWQNNIDADILVVGQEYCDTETYVQTEAKVERFSGTYEYPSNRNIKEYFDILGYDIGHPTSPNREHPIFFTNAVMGLKNGNMSANFQTSWLEESRDEFLKPLIDIIQPKIVIAIGAMATKSLGAIYGFKVTSHKEMVENAPIEAHGTLIFPVYHTGGLGLRNRSKADQQVDWTKIKVYL